MHLNLAGTPLTSFCDDRRLSIIERLDIFRQVLHAVEYAHANLVIHRDLKPSNILVTEDGHAHLLDFGIAKLLTAGIAKETELTQAGGRALTLDYASPEQIGGMPITTATDVYSLGVMLYELLSGERPYRLKRNTRGALEEAILHEDPVSASRAGFNEAAAIARSTTSARLTKTLRGDLDTIVLKALKKLPGARFATINAFDEDVHRFLRGDLVLAQPDSVAYRARKFVGRHRVAITAAGLLLLTMAGGLTATTYEAGLAAKQRDAALAAHFRLLTQTAAERVRLADVSDGMGIILEVLGKSGAGGSYYPELDVPRAIALYQHAWKDGVPIAGFELGALYEYGVRSSGTKGGYALAPDATQAWFWYQEAADAKEPHALARFAERYDDAALVADNEANRANALLTSFARYAAAAEGARSEDWPDDTWRNWRYRRASLARVLARDGLMYDAAKTYESVRRP